MWLAPTVGASGGSIAVAGLTLTVPAGALATDQAISVARTGAQVPQGYQALSPVYRFEPEGLVFAQPVSVAVDFAGTAAQTPALFWSVPGGEYERLEATIAGTRLTAEVTHFSTGFAGVRPAGPTIARVSPAMGIAGQTEVTILGTGFNPTHIVRLREHIGAGDDLREPDGDPRHPRRGHAPGPVSEAPPRTIMREPVQTAVCNALGPGAPAELTWVQLLRLAGS
jgi:hypothetical protein